jgi:uncharacterized membrane protein
MVINQQRMRELLIAEEQRRKQKQNSWMYETPRTIYVIDNSKNDLAKVIVWRVFSVPVSMIITYLFTGKADLSVSLTITLTILLTVAQYFYEKLWRYLHI